MTAAHRSGALAELVCSNSLKAEGTGRGPGLLKAEMRLLDSLVLQAAAATAVPAGQALAVDRDEFAAEIERRLAATGLVTVAREEVRSLGSGLTVLATGPMTSPALASELRRLAPFGTLRFYDAVSPTVSADSLDREIVFDASRYGAGDEGYLNCPFTREQYEVFLDALLEALVSEKREIPQVWLYDGCMPVEEIARRGRDALRFGPMKPVGLTDPNTGQRPWAVCQLRQENRSATMYNLVGFQTGLKWGEQDRVLRLIPGLERAEFLRYGVMHANVFLDSPRLLDPFGRLRAMPNVLVAGQLSGVEGYVESALSGLWCGLNAARLARDEEPLRLPERSLSGALLAHITSPESPDFQPMNANFGLLPPLEGGPKNKAERRVVMAEGALEEMKRFAEAHGYV